MPTSCKYIDHYYPNLPLTEEILENYRAIPTCLLHVVSIPILLCSKQIQGPQKLMEKVEGWFET
jgi:hypothetical protein